MSALGALFRCRPKLSSSRRLSCRMSSSNSEVWTEGTCKEIELKWKGKLGEHLKKKSDAIHEKPMYVLSMFPYPSGALHMGHVRVYSISDAMAHYFRMKGYNVIHPMGWDAFGLPAENAAIERGIDPREWTMSNIVSMRQRLDELGCVFDWDRELSTCDPTYYRWTQWIFLKMFEAGLAYRKRAIVNWDPVDKTVLADEQVDADGRSWRSGAIVEKRPLSQWFLKATDFSKDLVDGLDDPSLINWRDIKKMQQNWIGDCDGTAITFKVEEGPESLSVWTGHVERIYGASHIGLSKEHLLFNEELIDVSVHCAALNCDVHRLKTTASNPLSGKRIPIFAFDTTEHFPEGADSYLGGTLSDLKLDAEIAADLAIEPVDIVDAQGVLQNSGPYTGLKVDAARERLLEDARRLNIGGNLTSSRLGDWLISRQRYWGTPIPIIHCPKCGPVPVPADQLPVKLPEGAVPQGGCGECTSPLGQMHEWVNCKCPCSEQIDSKRETDTMDTFVDSSWYFLRYLDPKNDSEAVSRQRAAEGMPVGLYIGGKEHAVLHMYYARFVTHFLHRIGVSPVKEPFQRLLTQGMVKGKSYRVKGSGRYVRPSDVETRGEGKKETAVERATGEKCVVEWEKMSKSKHNGVDPVDILEKYGCDTTRWMMLCDVGPASERNWTEDSYARIKNIQSRFIKLVSGAAELQNIELPEIADQTVDEWKMKLFDARNYYLKGINHSYGLTRNLAVVISRIQSFQNELWNCPGQIKRDYWEYQRALGTSLIALAPIAPHFAAEMWERFAKVPKKHGDEFEWQKSVFQQTWPELDDTYNLKILVKSRGEDVVKIPVARWKFKELGAEEAFDLACHEPKIQEDVLPRDFTYEFSKFEDYEATLNFNFTQSEEDARAERQAKKEDKKRKKLERVERKKKIEANVAAKAAKFSSDS